MEKVQTVIELSGELYLALSAFGVNKEKIASESRKLLALKYFQEKFLSLGKAAELAGFSKWEFIEYLSDNNVPVINYDEDELLREFEVVETLTEQLKS
jgi:predicted HTH domain antitoxin